MIAVMTVKVNSGNCLGVQADLPDSPPLILISADLGFLMCGFLDIGVAENLGVVAAVVRGVKTVEDMLSAQVRAVTSKASNLGVEVGMTGARALEHMSI